MVCIDIYFNGTVKRFECVFSIKTSSFVYITGRLNCLTTDIVMHLSELSLSIRAFSGTLVIRLTSAARKRLLGAASTVIDDKHFRTNDAVFSRTDKHSGKVLCCFTLSRQCHTQDLLISLVSRITDPALVAAKVPVFSNAEFSLWFPGPTS